MYLAIANGPCTGSTWARRRQPAIRQSRRVLQPGADAVAALDPVPIHGPRRIAIVVVDPLDTRADPGKDRVNRGSMHHRGGRVRVERREEHSLAARREARRNESPGVVQRQQAALDPDATGQQPLAQLEVACFALIGCHELGQLGPSRDQRTPSPGRSGVPGWRTDQSAPMR